MWSFKNRQNIYIFFLINISVNLTTNYGNLSVKGNKNKWVIQQLYYKNLASI